MRDGRVRKKVLREQMDLKAALEHGKSLEITEEQVRRLQNSVNSVNSIQDSPKKLPNKYGKNRWERFSKNPEKTGFKENLLKLCWFISSQKWDAILPSQWKRMSQLR